MYIVHKYVRRYLISNFHFQCTRCFCDPWRHQSQRRQPFLRKLSRIRQCWTRLRWLWSLYWRIRSFWLVHWPSRPCSWKSFSSLGSLAFNFLSLSAEWFHLFESINTAFWKIIILFFPNLWVSMQTSENCVRKARA